MQFERLKQNNPYLVLYKGSIWPQIGQKWTKIHQNWGFNDLLAIRCSQIVLCETFLLERIIIWCYLKKLEQNNPYLVLYKGSIRPQIGQKWMKIDQNWGFSDFLAIRGDQIVLC